MSAPRTRDLEYRHGTTRMLGVLCTGATADGPRPGVLIVHGGFGLEPRMIDNAQRLAAQGYVVLAADVWGGRHLPAGPQEFGPLISRLAGDRATWLGRLDAARDVLLAQPEVASAPFGAVGYCFGGSSVLEYARAGREVAAVVSLHGGLDTVGTDWSQASASTSVLVLTGADDPLAPGEDLNGLRAAMSNRGLDWEVDVYGGADHAFTFPDSPNYHARSDRRSWLAMTRLLAERVGQA